MYNFVSMCLAPHLTRCHRSKLLKWLLLLSTIINSGYRFPWPFCLSRGLVSCYTMSLHHIDDNCFILELFHTKPPSVKVSDNCGFRYTFHMFYFCTHNLLRVLDLSNLAWGRHSQFYSSDLYLDWTFTKITRIHKICQGKFFTCALIMLSAVEAFGTIFISHWFLEH